LNLERGTSILRSSTYIYTIRTDTSVFNTYPIFPNENYTETIECSCSLAKKPSSSALTACTEFPRRSSHTMFLKMIHEAEALYIDNLLEKHVVVVYLMT